MQATLINPYDPTHFESLYNAARRWSVLWKRYALIFEGVPLLSPEARQARETQNLLRQHEKNIPPPLDPPPADRIRARLEEYELGDTKAWWVLNFDLTLTLTGRHYDDLQFLITEMPGWIAADERTKSRIIEAARSYLDRAQPELDRWIGTSSFRRSDIAAYRAFLFLYQERPDEYAGLSQALWTKWAPVIVAAPKETGTEKSRVFEVILADASKYAPDEFARTVQMLIELERSRNESSTTTGQSPQIHFYFLRSLDGCWENNSLKVALFKELQDARNSPGQFDALLEALLKAKFSPARDYALSRLRQMTSENAQIGLAAATNLIAYCAADVWAVVWPILTENQEFGKQLFLGFAPRFRFDTSPFNGLSEQHFADLYVWFERVFPRSSDPQHQSGEVHWVGPRESLGDLRDTFLRHLVGLGTVESVRAIGWIVAELPHLQWLRWHLREAERNMRMKTWAPLAPVEILRLTKSPEARLIQSPEDLRIVLVEALDRYRV